MSGSPVPVDPGIVDRPGTLSLSPMIIPCLGDKCQWWADRSGKCVVVDGLQVGMDKSLRLILAEIRDILGKRGK